MENGNETVLVNVRMQCQQPLSTIKVTAFTDKVELNNHRSICGQF